jgi:hypothetical protein
LPAPHVEDPWEVIDIPGIGGLTSVLAGLCIWGLSINKADTPHADAFVRDGLQAIDDVYFAVGEVIAARLS